MTDRIIGAIGVLDLDRLYITLWSVWILCLSVGRLVLPTYESGGVIRMSSILEHLHTPLFLFFDPLSPIYSTGGLWLFSKVGLLIEVGRYFSATVLCSTIVYTRHPLDNCSPHEPTTVVWFPLSTWHRPAFPMFTINGCDPAISTSIRFAGFPLVITACPVVPLPHHGYHALRALLNGSSFKLIITPAVIHGNADPISLDFA